MSEDLPNDSQAMAVALVGGDQRVLELGCGAGHVTAQLRAAGCSVVGVEIDRRAADAASAFTEAIHVVDLDNTHPVEFLGDATFDRIVVGDVLEHLKDPDATLATLKAHLDPGGLLVASIPNVTHADVRLMLLGGQWRYQDTGLLDRTHMRFFDLRGLLELFERAGWRIERLERTTKEPLSSELAELARAGGAVPGVLEALRDDPEASTYQFVAVATVGEAHPDALERFGPPGHGDATAMQRAQRTTESDRLHGENARLRVRVRELEELVEDAHWSAAIWRKRLRALAQSPRRFLRRFSNRYEPRG